MSRKISHPFLKLTVGAAALSLGASGAATADQVFADDVIVQFSLCVGTDCVNGESFGFDTIRLKENNLRIGFADTSTSSGFPSNDWELTANDADNGGLNKFSITDVTGGKVPFTVEAGARANAIYAKSNLVGFGTASPVVEMHTVDGDSPTLRLEQDGSSGFAPQTWDIAGNEAGFFVRDVTNGSTLPFRILPGVRSDFLVVSGSDRVGIGAGTSPDTPLHVQTATGGLVDMVKLENNGDIAMIFSNTASGAPTPEWKLASFNGNVFIGTPTSPGPEFLLSNTGNLTISGTLTTGSSTVYPDYVFADDYGLMPLDELDAYIAENGHLPKIPKADEVARNGLNISDMQVALLEKVEELTLYTLQQQRTISALQSRIEFLED